METKQTFNKLTLAAAVSLASASAFADVPVAELAKNIEMYGVLDFGVTWVDDEGGENKVTARDSVNWGNRIGFKGAIPLTDDLQGVCVCVRVRVCVCACACACVCVCLCVCVWL